MSSKVFTFYCLCIQFPMSSYPVPSPINLFPHQFVFFYQIHLGRKRAGVLYEEASEEEGEGSRCSCLSSLLVNSFGLFATCFSYTFLFCLDGPMFIITDGTMRILYGMFSCFKLDALTSL